MRGFHEEKHVHRGRNRGEMFWGDPGFREWGGPFRRGGGGRRRIRRGDIRQLLLVALLEGPAHGYEIIRRLEERSNGLWRPSPGSVYPTLQLLADEGLVTSTEEETKRVYSLNDAGRKEAEAHKDDPSPWSDEAAEDEKAMMMAAVQVLHAAKQVAQAANADQIERAVKVLRQTRQSLYQILAED